MGGTSRLRAKPPRRALLAQFPLYNIKKKIHYQRSTYFPYLSFPGCKKWNLPQLALFNILIFGTCGVTSLGKRHMVLEVPKSEDIHMCDGGEGKMNIRKQNLQMSKLINNKPYKWGY